MQLKKELKPQFERFKPGYYAKKVLVELQALRGALEIGNAPWVMVHTALAYEAIHEASFTHWERSIIAGGGRQTGGKKSLKEKPNDAALRKRVSREKVDEIMAMPEHRHWKITNARREAAKQLGLSYRTVLRHTK